MRNSTIDIAKGIAIILMVVGHSCCPEGLYKFIYSFHMPLFFILSGYFLSEKSLSDTRSFVINKWKKLALPLLICGIVSLLLHNLFFHWGIINEFYGTSAGDVAHLFGWKDFLLRIGLLIGFLEVYDDPFLGACWFIQCMFFAYIGIAFIHKLCCNFSWQKQRIIGICIFVGVSISLTATHWLMPSINTVFVTRVSMAGVFLYIGSFMRRTIENWNLRWWYLCLLLIAVSCVYVCPLPIRMDEQIIPAQFIILLFTGLCGTLFIYGLSTLINLSKSISTILQKLGKYSIYILFLHIAMFKPISYLFIKIYDLNPLWISCRPTIYQIANSWHWIIYSTGSILLCLTIAFINQKIKLYASRIHYNAHL